MKTNLEYIEKFNVYGYSSPVINEATHEREVAQLREKYEATLKSAAASSDLHFVIWFVDTSHWIYHFGITKWDSFADSGATCVEVPAGYFAMGTVSDGMGDLEAWDELFKSEVNSARVVADIVEEENRKYFECFTQNGSRKIFAPVVNIND